MLCMQAWLTPAKVRSISAAPLEGKAPHSPPTGLCSFPESSYRTPDNNMCRAKDDPVKASLAHQCFPTEGKQGSTAASEDTVWQIEAQQLSFQVNLNDTGSPYNAKQPHIGDRSSKAASEETHSIASVSCSTARPPYRKETTGMASIADGHSSQGSASDAEAPNIPGTAAGSCSKANKAVIANSTLRNSPLSSAHEIVSVMADDAFSKTSKAASADMAGQRCTEQESTLSPIQSPCTPADSMIMQAKPAAFHSDRDSLDPFLTRHMCLQQLEALRGQGYKEVGVCGPELPLPFHLPSRAVKYSQALPSWHERPSCSLR